MNQNRNRARLSGAAQAAMIGLGLLAASLVAIFAPQAQAAVFACLFGASAGFARQHGAAAAGLGSRRLQADLI